MKKLRRKWKENRSSNVYRPSISKMPPCWLNFQFSYLNFFVFSTRELAWNWVTNWKSFLLWKSSSLAHRSGFLVGLSLLLRRWTGASLAVDPLKIQPSHVFTSWRPQILRKLNFSIQRPFFESFQTILIWILDLIWTNFWNIFWPFFYHF